MDIVQGVDLAISEKQTADYTAIATVGYSPSLEKIYVINFWRGQVSFPEQLKAIKEQASIYRPKAVVIETNVYQKVLATQLQTSTMLPIMGKVTVKDKIQRILGNLSPHFESKKLVVRRDMHDFLSEYLEFPDGSHDDMLDALEFAVSYIADSNWNKMAQYSGSGAAFGRPKGTMTLQPKDKDRFLGTSDWWLGKERPGKKEDKT
jgi:predicted phage terminase large subunit-like protein